MSGNASVQLLTVLEEAVRSSVTADSAIAFSGGLDSGLIATISKRYGNFKLYTVGTDGSHDVAAAKELAEIMDMRWEHIPIRIETLEDELREMIRITGNVNPITLSFEIPLFYVLRYSKERNIISGQGADELFAGFAKYEGLEMQDLKDKMKEDLIELIENTLEHERKMAEHFGKTITYPYLDKDVRRIVGQMDINDIAPKDLRKSVLRDIANSMGRPEIAMRPKKAAQYGSGTMSALRSIAKKRGTTVSGLVSAISEGS